MSSHEYQIASDDENLTIESSPDIAFEFVCAEDFITDASESTLVQPGPDNLKELFDFVVPLVRSILASDRRENFLQNAKTRLAVHLRYAGAGAEITILHWISKALILLGEADCNFECGFVVTASDTSKLSRSVLHSFPASIRAKHIYGDHMARHSEQLKTGLDQVTWPKKSNDKSQKHHAVKQAIDASTNIAIEAMATSMDLLTQPTAYTDDDAIPCECHGQDCQIATAKLVHEFPEIANMISVMSAGVACTDFTTEGDQKKSKARPRSRCCHTAMRSSTSNRIGHGSSVLQVGMRPSRQQSASKPIRSIRL
jgi:hypothetical protein